MFYPQEMSEIEIVVPAKDLLPVTKALSGQGVFSQQDVNYLGSEKESAQENLWQEKSAQYSLLERRLQSIFQSLGMHDSTPTQQDYGDLVDIEASEKTINAIESIVKNAIDQINSLNKQIEHWQNLIQQISPISDIDLDISKLRNSRYLVSTLGMMPPEQIGRLKESLNRIPYVFYTLSQKGQKAVVFIATSRDNEEMFQRATRAGFLDPISLPDNQTGTPAEIIHSANDEITSCAAKIAELTKSLEATHQEKHTELVDLLWKVRCSRMMTAAILHYGKLKYTYIIVGWVYSSQVDSLKAKIKAVSKDALIETRVAPRVKEASEVPIALNNPGLIRPFQMLVKTYAVPKYGELDPTPLVAILFPVLFGAMFGDVGHGLILAILGGIVTSKKVKAFRGLASLGPIVLACGILSMIFGFLYGSIFGYEEVLRPLWMQPGKNIMTILIITIAGGMVVLSLGFLLNIFNALRVKDWSLAFFNHNGVIGLVLYWSLIGLVLSALVPAFPLPANIFVITAIIGALGMMFSDVFIRLIEGHRPLIEGGFAMFFVQAFFELFETVISYLSNSLSFVRVGAFAVAHGNLAAVFFILAQMVDPSKGIGYWIMYLVGLLFIVGFEGLIVGIQTMRLTYYEIFGKFFTGGGKQFEPLSLHPAEND
jgi:V/A-type H+-transporting ATPase subunit I